jgi:Beta-propeller repeat
MLDFPTGSVFPGRSVAVTPPSSGTSFEQGLGIAVDGEGRAYVMGSTSSTDFAITLGAFDTSFDGRDAFVTKLRTD